MQLVQAGCKGGRARRYRNAETDEDPCAAGQVERRHDGEGADPVGVSQNATATSAVSTRSAM